MCGRFVSSSPPGEIADYFGVDVMADLSSEGVDGDGSAAGGRARANYNVAPTTDVMCVYVDDGLRRLDPFRWGLVPGWAKDLSIGSRMINARAETVASKPAFRSSFAKRRCILPVDGFYEWKTCGPKKKQPYFIHRPDGEPYAFGGLWAQWRGVVAGEELAVRSSTIITGQPNEKMAQIHDRMPLILPREAWDEWLDPTVTDPARITRLLVPAPIELIEFHPVSTQVNSVRNNGAQLIEEVPIDESPVDEAAPDAGAVTTGLFGEGQADASL